MSDTLLQHHLGQRQRYWVHDAYENSATPLGDDEWWDLTLEPAGVATVQIEIVHAYTNELLSLIAIQGPWVLVESNKSAYTITIEQPIVRLVQGQAAALAAWQHHPQITLTVTATSIERHPHAANAGTEA
ncbi:MAG: hypothetical protein Fur005_45620 [Roseiflexaceae bacterium]